MRKRVREWAPTLSDQDLQTLVDEELVASVDAGPAGHPPNGGAQDQAAVEVHRAGDDRRATAADLGPNGDVVLEWLARAAELTPDECRHLEREATWCWTLVTPVASVGSVPVARALALVRGRQAGRADAIAALRAEITAIARRRSNPRQSVTLAACLTDAGLALLVRDLIAPEVFDQLHGPWLAVMHH
jgi:hypothetical protein